jgi:hypothetical protein
VLSVNAQFLAGLLDVPVVADPSHAHRVCTLDALAFCRADERNPARLAHTWNVTSDSIAARLAQVVGGSLTLLKSVELPPDLSWGEAAQRGLVDAEFPSVVADAKLSVDWVNLRRSEWACAQ